MYVRLYWVGLEKDGMVGLGLGSQGHVDGSERSKFGKSKREKKRGIIPEI
jgi:hypothetical protein